MVGGGLCELIDCRKMNDGICREMNIPVKKWGGISRIN